MVITLEPKEPGKGYEFVDAIKGGVVPREYIPAVDKGIQETLKAGVLAGYPGGRREGHADVRFVPRRGLERKRVPHGRFDGVQGSHAQGEARCMLEPMMAVEVETPEDYMGNVMGDLSRRRGIVQGMEDMAGGGGKIVRAEVPLSEMFGYSTTLRSLTQGRATYTMEFKHYSEAPRNVAEAIINAKSK